MPRSSWIVNPIEKAHKPAGPSFLRLPLMLAVASFAPMDGAGAQVWTTQVGGCALIITAEGSIFASGYIGPNTCLMAQSSWSPLGSVFASAGHGFGSEIVGLNSRGQVLASNGDEYQLHLSQYCPPGGVTASFVVNVFSFTEVEPIPGETFCGFGDSNGSHTYAVTSHGRVFRRLVTGCDPLIWEFAGDLPIGPVEATRSSWGTLKVRYR